MTFREAMSLGEQILQSVGIEDAKTDSWLLLAMVCHINHTYYYMHMDEDLPDEELNEFQTVLKKRAERVPLQYITGEQEFMGLTFKVNSNVLIPRQDTETLVEQALKVASPGMHILDMCTGSGCILISLLKNVSDAKGLGVDVSKQALIVAKENARLHNVDADFERSNLFENISGLYDMIVSNPPYIPSDVIPTLMPEVCQFEPMQALDGDADGLTFYRRIVCDAKSYLKENGYLMFEIGHDQGEAVSSMMQDAGYREVAIVKDLAGNDRVVKGRL